VSGAVFMHMRLDAVRVLMRRGFSLGKAMDRIAAMREGKHRMRRENAKCVKRDEQGRERSTVCCNSSTHSLSAFSGYVAFN